VDLRYHDFSLPRQFPLAVIRDGTVCREECA
jgi:hypothetical protein